MDKFQSLVELAPWTIILQICNLLLQAYLFKRFLFKPVREIISKRQAEVNDIYANAQKAETTAKDSEAKYTSLLSGAKAEANELVRTATVNAQRRSDEMIRAAKDEATAIKQRASADIAQEKKKAINEIKDDISGMAVSIAAKVVEKEINEADQEALISSFIEKLGDKA